MNTVDDMLAEHYLPPGLRAQIFDFLADLPGTRVEGNTVDVTGRHGIAVTKTVYGQRNEYVFEPGTYRFLGSREIYLGPPGHLQVKAVDRLPKP